MAINVRDFVYENITPYTGDDSFLVGPTEATTKLWEECSRLLKLERDKNGLLDVDFETISNVTSHKPGYILKDLETIV